MTYELTSQQRATILSTSSEQRYDYCIEQIVRCNEIWILSDANGCVLFSSDGQECIPVWPHPDFAADWISGQWTGCKPLALSLDVWRQRWVPGMLKDGVAVVVFPNAEEEGVVASPEEVQVSIDDLLA